MTLNDWAFVASIITAIVTFVGVVGSLWVAIATLRDVQRDRVLRHRPYVAFEPGGCRYAVEFVAAGKRIPGIDPKYVEKVFKELPENAESVRLKLAKAEDGEIAVPVVGRLKNYGSGPGFETTVVWIPQEIWFGNEKFILDSPKLSEPIYCPAFNTTPSFTRHLSPGDTSHLTRLPTFIEKDVDRKVSRVDGVVEIISCDVFKKRHIVRQGFYLETAYKEPKPYVHITFLYLIGDGEKQQEAS